ncbi:hypothetical protein MMMDOFMJ_4114 [Methylobacterium gnaphalii]|uniref:DUF4089 domain-containing protein n=1 Tax=Methylobacterium gnaphalii TaxID=1010610 RepID=A0A512JME7_9HYPH|nr:DUF4089 domain-containing protein [Methylobacterium gnaphalii]GEP11141.1 hypothetical protein MGN01_29860 [Methylobacterium gnaphalii]GJD71160.1 hypothetical protein MMMDOFMJ_4114 [Methylobacterium gnaphalii]GLS49646.1 hypothetical protein GCM10007885_24960 [Methylobacterium gnaphalii]
MAARDTKPAFDPDAYLSAGLGILDLAIDPDWAPAIVANLKVLHAAAELVASFLLADEAEAAPVFEA